MDSVFDKARELRKCAAAWEPGVRLLGNIRADEIIGILDAYEAEIAELQRRLDAVLELGRTIVQWLSDYQDQATMVSTKRYERAVAIESTEEEIEELAIAMHMRWCPEDSWEHSCRFWQNELRHHARTAWDHLKGGA